MTIGRMLSNTAWKIIRASAGERIRIPVHVARCMVSGDGMGSVTKRSDQRSRFKNKYSPRTLTLSRREPITGLMGLPTLPHHPDNIVSRIEF